MLVESNGAHHTHGGKDPSDSSALTVDARAPCPLKTSLVFSIKKSY